MKSDRVKVFFNPKNVAVIGANRAPNKVGHTIFRNMMESFKGNVYPVNPNAEELLGRKAFKSVLNIPGKIDMAIIAVPATIVPKVMEECGKKRVKGVIVISSGFGEIGNTKQENKLKEIAKKHKMSLIGPNCLGVFDPYTGVDTLFLSKYKLSRPDEGKISFISQSGALGASVLDWMADEGLGFSKFISYGNAADIDDAELLEFVGNDSKTKVIVMYLEGTKNGKRLMEVAKQVTKKKPIIIIKSGRTENGSKAVSSHTGSLAGGDNVYDAVFKQVGMIRAKSVMEAMDYAKAFVEQPLPKGKNVLIITNGGGSGVMATDCVIQQGLELPEINNKNALILASKLPPYAAVHNPLDLVGDADTRRYQYALEFAEKTDNIDAVLCIVLFQTANLDPDVVDTITEFSNLNKKPIMVCALGGDYTKVNTRSLEKAGIPCHKSVSSSAKTLAAMYKYSKYRGKIS